MKAVRAALAAWTMIVLLFLYLPLLVLVAFSFNASRLNIQWQGFTLDWYVAILGDAALVRALGNSVIVAAATTVLAVALGTAAAWLFHRYRFPGAAALLSLALVPVISPEVIMGVSLLILFVTVHLELGYLTVIIAHVTFCFPFVMVAVQARIAGLDPALEEAALDLGASPPRALRTVVLPLLAPAIIAGALMAATLSLDELIVTAFTASAATRTLPLEIFGRIRKGLDPSLNAISTLFIAAALIAALATHRLARRRGPRALLLGAILAAGALLAGCARPQASGPAPLTLFAWSEYVPRAVIDGFTAETGIAVHYDTYASNEEMLAKLVAGGQRYDLIQPSEYAVEALAREDRLLPIDWSRVPNIEHVAAPYTHMRHDPDQRYTVPWMAGSVGIVVNTAKVHDPITAYRDVFQERYRGRIVVVDDPRELVSWALASLGKGPNDVTDETLALVKPVLQRWLPLIKVYDSDSPKTALLNGDVDLGIVWSGEAALLYRENPQFTYVLPAEGSHGYVDSLAIPVNAANPDAAMRFMNYVLRPDVSRLISAEFPYTNPNLAARALLSPEERRNPASYPPREPRFEGLRDIGPMAIAVDKLVTALKAGSF